MSNYVEYQCPCGQNFTILVGTVPKCPKCGHIFTHTEVQIHDGLNPKVIEEIETILQEMDNEPNTD